MILANFEYKVMTQLEMAKLVNIKSTYTLDCIRKNISYKDYKYEYDNLNEEDKKKIVSLLRN